MLFENYFTAFCLHLILSISVYFLILTIALPAARFRFLFEFHSSLLFFIPEVWSKSSTPT